MRYFKLKPLWVLIRYTHRSVQSRQCVKCWRCNFDTNHFSFSFFYVLRLNSQRFSKTSVDALWMTCLCIRIAELILILHCRHEQLRCTKFYKFNSWIIYVFRLLSFAVLDPCFVLLFAKFVVLLQCGIFLPFLNIFMLQYTLMFGGIHWFEPYFILKFSFRYLLKALVQTAASLFSNKTSREDLKLKSNNRRLQHPFPMWSRLCMRCRSVLSNMQFKDIVQLAFPIRSF